MKTRNLLLVFLVGVLLKLPAIVFISPENNIYKLLISFGVIFDIIGLFFLFKKEKKVTEKRNNPY